MSERLTKDKANMRKVLALFIVLALTIVALTAEPVLTITKGNNYEILNNKGEKATGSGTLDGAGYMLRTKNEAIEATSALGKLYLEPNSLIVLTDTSASPSLYLVCGKMGFVTDSRLSTPLSIYTPTTLTTIIGKGESIFISTESEEKFYNFTDSNATSYNAINGKKYEVGTLESVDFLTNSTTSERVKRDTYKTLTVANELLKTPAKPTLFKPNRTLSTILPTLPYRPNVEVESIKLVQKLPMPQMPFVENRTLVDNIRIPNAQVPTIEKAFLVDTYITKSIATEKGDILIKAGTGNATFTYPESIKDEYIQGLISELTRLNPRLYSQIAITNIATGRIDLSYPIETNKVELENTINTVANDIRAYLADNPFETKAVIAPSLEKTLQTSKGEFKLIVADSLTTIETPETLAEDTLSYLKAKDINASLYSINENGLITIEYPKKEDLHSYIDTLSLDIEEYASALPIEENTAKEETSKPTIKSSIVPSTKRELSFDVRLSTRAYTDSNKNQSLTTSVMPALTYGSFKLAFNLDPIAIADYEDNEGWEDWLGYSLNFINALQYRTMNEVFSFAIDKETKINGDLLGLYDGVDHIWDKEYQPLTFFMGVDSKHFGMNVFFNDLTFGRFSNSTEKTGTAGIDVRYKVSDRIPVSFNAGLLLNMDYDAINKMLIYPELSLYIPFYSKGYNTAGLSLGFASRIDLDDPKYNPLDGGFMFSAEIPLNFYSFKSSLGIYYTNQGDNTSTTPIHYRAVDNPRYTNLSIANDDTIITLAGNIGYSSSLFGIDLAVLSDLATSDMKFIDENNLLEASTYLSFKGITLKAGISMQNFLEGDLYEEQAKIYTGLDLDIGGVATYLKVGIDSIKEKDFFLSYGATASFMGKSEDRTDNPVKLPFSFEITTGYEYRYEDEASRYLIKPAMTFGEGNYILSLRAPFLLTFDSSKSFNLAGPGNGRKWWNFGSDESGKKRVFYAVTDALQIINYIKIGDTEESVAYINAQRDFLMNDTLFTAFGADEALSVRTGFNFHNLSIGIYGGNIESPHIGELKIGIYPINQESLSIDVSIPAEFYIEDTKNFALYFYPEARLNVPLLRNRFNLALYAVGSISAIYENGEPTTTNVIYDFENDRVFAALFGGEIGFTGSSFSIKLQGGWRTGPLTPDMYNIFTSTYNLTPSIISSSESSSYDSSFYAKIVTEFNFKPFEMELAYSVRDVEKLIDDYSSYDSDIFSTKLRINFNKTISLYGAFHRKGFVSLFRDGTDFKSDIFESANSIYSIGMDFDYGIVSINAEYSSALDSSGFATSTDFININPAYISSTISSSFSVTTRIKF